MSLGMISCDNATDFEMCKCLKYVLMITFCGIQVIFPIDYWVARWHHWAAALVQRTAEVLDVMDFNRYLSQPSCAFLKITIILTIVSLCPPNLIHKGSFWTHLFSSMSTSWYYHVTLVVHGLHSMPVLLLTCLPWIYLYLPHHLHLCHHTYQESSALLSVVGPQGTCRKTT